jgi:site-specific DNA recombinase
MRYAIYVRVSTEEQAQHGFSIEAQKEKDSAFVTSQDGTIHKIYVDDGYSGKDIKRPALQSLLQAAEEKKFDIVLVYKLDRLSRRLSDLVSLGEKFEHIGVGIKSVTEPFDTTTPAGKLMFNMLGSFAQFERELIGERTKLGIMRRIKNGEWSTTRPFGYDLKDGKLIVNEVESEIVKKCYRLFLEHNLGVELLARRMNKEDLISKRKDKWSKNSVWTMLTNPVYTGYIRWDGEVVKGQHQLIISKQLFDTVQERLKEKDRYAPWVGISPNLFIGLIFCSKCATQFISSKPGNGSKKGKYRYYACKGRKRGKCTQDYIRADVLEEIIFNKIKEIASHEEIIQDYLKKACEENNLRLQELKREKLQASQRLTKISQLKDKKIKWMLSHLPGKKVATEMGNEVEKLLDEIDILKQRLVEIEAKMQQVDLDDADTQIIADFLQNFTERFDKLETGEKKLLIQAVVKRIEVYNKNKISLKLTLPILPENKECESKARNSGVPAFASSSGLAARC